MQDIFADLIPGNTPARSPVVVGTPRPKKEDAPSGYRFDANGNLVPIPGGPADKTSKPESNDPPSGYRWGDAGNLVPIPGGPADKAVVDPKILADEKTAAFLTTNLVGNARILAKALRKDPSVAAPTWAQKAAGLFGQDIKNKALPDQRQVVEDSQLAILDAALTLGTGAAYTREQLEGYRQSYFPQIGDSPPAIAAKKERLRIALAAAKLKAGNAAPQIDAALAELGYPAEPDSPAGGQLVGGGTIQFNDASKPPELPKIPLTQEQIVGYDAFMKSMKPGTLDPNVLGQFFQNLTGRPLAPGSAEQIARAFNEGNGLFQSAADAKYIPGRDMEGLKASRDQVGGKAGATDLTTSGMVLGADDEAAGVGNVAANAISTLVSNIAGDGSIDFNPAEAYVAGKGAQQLRLNEARNDLGGMGTALEVGGMVLSGRPTAALPGMVSRPTRFGWSGRAPRGLDAIPTRVGRITESAKGGAAAGGFAGWAEGEGGVESALSGVGSSIAGAGIGAAVPMAFEGIGASVNGIRTLLGNPRETARRVVTNALTADGSDPLVAGLRMADMQSRGTPAMLADTGENARNTLASVTRQPGESRTIGLNAVTERQTGFDELGNRVGPGQTGRLEADIARDLGAVVNPYQVARGIDTQAKRTAAPLYDQFYAAPGASSVKIDDLANRDSFKDALKRAERLVREDGGDPTALGFQLNDAGEVTLERVPSFQTLDYVKRGLDDIVYSNRDPLTGAPIITNETRGVNNTRRMLLARMDRAAPVYRQARRAWAGPISNKDALEQGLKALKRDDDDVVEIMRGMQPSELEHFRAGYRHALAKEILGKGDTANKATTLLGNEKRRRAVQQVFGSLDNYGRFLASIGDEQAAFRTYARAATGSPTALNQNVDQATSDQGLVETVTDAALRGGGLWQSLLSVIRQQRPINGGGGGARGEAARAEVARLLTNTDPAVAQELIALAQIAARRQAARLPRQTQAARLSGRIEGSAAGTAIGGTQPQLSDQK